MSEKMTLGKRLAAREDQKRLEQALEHARQREAHENKTFP